MITLFNINLTEFDTDLTENIPIDPVAMEFSLVLKASACPDQGFQSNLLKLQFQQKENLTVYGLLRSFTENSRSFNRSKNMIGPAPRK